jgi:hypothetical protein
MDRVSLASFGGAGGVCTTLPGDSYPRRGSPEQDELRGGVVSSRFALRYLARQSLRRSNRAGERRRSVTSGRRLSHLARGVDTYLYVLGRSIHTWIGVPACSFCVSTTTDSSSTGPARSVPGLLIDPKRPLPPNSSVSTTREPGFSLRRNPYRRRVPRWIRFGRGGWIPRTSRPAWARGKRAAWEGTPGFLDPELVDFCGGEEGAWALPVRADVGPGWAQPPDSRASGNGVCLEPGGRHGFTARRRRGLLSELARLPLCETQRPFSGGYSQRACSPCAS